MHPLFLKWCHRAEHGESSTRTVCLKLTQLCVIKCVFYSVSTRLCMITVSFIYSLTLPFNFWWWHLARASKNLWRGVYLLSSSRSTQRVRIINSCLSIFCNNPKSYWPNANLWVSLKKNALPLQHSTPKKDNDCIVSCSPTVNEPFYMTSSSTRCVYHELWAHYFVEEDYIHNQSSLCF